MFGDLHWEAVDIATWHDDEISKYILLCAWAWQDDPEACVVELRHELAHSA